MTAPTPAVVSGPGPYARRTDGGQPVRDLPDARYGENRDFTDQQRGAPLASGPDRPAGPYPSDITAAMTRAAPQDRSSVPGAAPDIVSASAPTTMPDQHVTTGMQTGPSPARPTPTLTPGQLSEALAPYAAADDSGVLNDLVWQLTDQGI